jgi:predicted enzyme related to lactoylglutathione lyase
MKNNPVGWFEIYVDDMNRAKTFYEAVFETTLEKLPAGDLEMWNFPMSRDCTGESSGAAGALVCMPGCKAGGGGTIVYFVCDDCAVEAARVEPAGGKVFKPKFSIGPYGFISLVVDTEGNMFGLHSMK